MKRISYFPVGDFSNSYTNIFISFIRRDYIYENILISDIFHELLRFNFKRRDIVVLNWFENLFVNDDGKITIYLFLKSFIKFLIFRFKFKKVVYVRHNVYPHHLNIKYINIAKLIISILSRWSSVSITHSPVFKEFNEIYIPHPLYDDFQVGEHNSKERNPNLYIIFGRISRYKNFEEIIDSFPADKELVILGACDDKCYLDELNSHVKFKGNITIRPGYISDNDARKYFSTANALLLSHSDPHMIVSGSFFYALTMGIKVLCISTPFLNWTQNILGDNVVKNFESIDALTDYLSNDSTFEGFTDAEYSKIASCFSNNTVNAAFKNLIDNEI